MLHQITVPLIMRVWPPPPAASLSAMSLAALAHLAAADPLHRVVQKLGFADVALHRLHRMWPFVFLSSARPVGLRTCPPSLTGLGSIGGRIFGPLVLARPILARPARYLDATESR